jgi:tRNA-splicing ligase RtcB
MVGVDIGCGMCAVNTHIKVEEMTQEKLKEIMGKIREVVPVGFAHQEKAQDIHLMPRISDKLTIIDREFEKARSQIGTLGGGNHFIEIQKSDIGEVWVMIHSGSRNLGKQVADYYNQVAIDLANRFYIPNVVKQDLAYLPVESIEAQDYIKEMQYCVDFAFANRKRMIDRVRGVFADVIGKDIPDDIINIAHNYAQLEWHMGKNVWVHRKGATSAREGEIGIIPGSMGTKSYIVKGKGNKESFMSCSHGAGRRMGRMEASRQITLEEADKSMEGVLYGRWGLDRNKNLDFGEAPQAYKDIDIVMENQKDLVEIVTELKPMAVIKG